MYRRPTLFRFGTMRDLTRAGCFGPTDNFSLPNVGTSVGETPRVTPQTIDICLEASG